LADQTSDADHVAPILGAPLRSIAAAKQHELNSFAARQRQTQSNQMNQLTSETASQTSMAIHARVTTAMAPIVIQRTIVPIARLKAPAGEIGGV
jgi:hypothetical protein